MLCDVGQGIGPTDRFEAPLTLRTHSPQGCGDAIGAVHPVEEAVHLGAQFARAVRVTRVTAQLDGDTLIAIGLHRDVPTATVGAIVMAGAMHDVLFGGGIGECGHVRSTGRKASPASSTASTS